METDLRWWINLCETPLAEAVIRLEMRYGVLPVWRNPTRQQTATAFAKFGLLRGMTDLAGDLYVWEACEASHDDVDELLGVDICHRFLMSPTTVTTQLPDAAMLSKVPALKRAYGGIFGIETDKDHDW